MIKRRPIYVDYMLIAFDSFIIGFTIKNMYDPVNLVTDGASDLAIIMKKPGKILLWVTNTVANTPLFLAAYKIKGWKLIKRILIATASLPVSLYVLPYTPLVTDDSLLASLFGGVVTGAGAGLMLLCKATTGGTGMLAVLPHRKFRHYSIAQIIQVLGGIIMLMGATVFSIRFALYTLISTYTLAKITGGMIEGMKLSKQAFTTLDKGKEIAETTITEMERGATALDAAGMYSELGRQMLFRAAPKEETVQLKEIMQSHDAGASVIINNVREVFGERFIEY